MRSTNPLRHCQHDPLVVLVLLVRDNHINDNGQLPSVLIHVWNLGGHGS